MYRVPRKPLPGNAVLCKPGMCHNQPSHHPAARLHSQTRAAWRAAGKAGRAKPRSEETQRRRRVSGGIDMPACAALVSTPATDRQGATLRRRTGRCGRQHRRVEAVRLEQLATPAAAGSAQHNPQLLSARKPAPAPRTQQEEPVRPHPRNDDRAAERADHPAALRAVILMRSAARQLPPSTAVIRRLRRSLLNHTSRSDTLPAANPFSQAARSAPPIPRRFLLYGQLPRLVTRLRPTSYPSRQTPRYHRLRYGFRGSSQVSNIPTTFPSHVTV